MAKISLNLPDELDKTIREYSNNNDLTLTETCTQLLKKALEEEAINSVELSQLKTKIEELEKERLELANKLELEKDTRLNEYKSIIAQNIETSKTLIELMKADRVLELQKQPEKKPFFEKIKALFSGNQN